MVLGRRDEGESVGRGLQSAGPCEQLCVQGALWGDERWGCKSAGAMESLMEVTPPRAPSCYFRKEGTKHCSCCNLEGGGVQTPQHR